jgi:hypothetical protein
MAFTVKNWEDSPSTTTPLSAAAMENLETRLGAYTDLLAAGSAGVIVHNGTAYPSRATGYASVIWIGPTPPTIGTSPNAVNGDLWVDTTP